MKRELLSLLSQLFAGPVVAAAPCGAVPPPLKARAGAQVQARVLPQITGLDPDQIQFFQVKTSYWEQESPQQYVLPSAVDFQAFSAAHSHIAEDPAFIDAVGILDQSFLTNTFSSAPW